MAGRPKNEGFVLSVNKKNIKNFRKLNKKRIEVDQHSIRINGEKIHDVVRVFDHKGNQLMDLICVCGDIVEFVKNTEKGSKKLEGF